MRVYLAGPMTGIPAMNFPAFDEAAGELRERGIDVVSPAELDSPESREAALASVDGSPAGYAEGETWGQFLARDVKLIADEGIEAIVVLPGWFRSRGARLETFVARLCGLPILRYPDLTAVDDHTIEDAHGNPSFSPDPTGFLERVDAPAESIRRARKEAGVKPGESLLGLDLLEGEIRVTDATTGGEKGQKQGQLGALDPQALLRVGEVAGFGAQKYARLNYLRGFAWSLAFDALMRHALEHWAGNEIDPESGLPHIAHAAWQCLCLLSFMERDLGTDDRVSAGLHLLEA